MLEERCGINMKSVPKLIRRFISILFLSFLLLIIVNLAFLGIIAKTQEPNSHPWTIAKDAAKSLKKTENGYVMPNKMAEKIKKDDAWAVFLENETGKCVWNLPNLPDSIPLEYTISDIANLTRGYIDGYPTFVGTNKDGLIILGYPKDRFWKHMWPSWDYNFIANLPRTILIVTALNILIIFIIYMAANTKMLKSIKPITDGIQALPKGEAVVLKEEGLLSEISANINRISEVLQSKNYQLLKKETARANWIAGVSHDIRTPLSMIMGYAAQLNNSRNLSEDEQEKAAIILKQSERIRNLINNLNLASKLEYNMQPINVQRTNIIPVVRQVAVDFINLDIEGRYPIQWLTYDSFNKCMVDIDKDLIKRAISNLIQNSINHNTDGCEIYILVKAEDNCHIIVSDNGIGADDMQIKKLNASPHYIVCDENTLEQRHGLGLLIVKQIITAHNGTMKIGHSKYGGFEVDITLPIA